MKKVGKSLMSLFMVTLLCVTCTGCGMIRTYQRIGEAVLGAARPQPRHDDTLQEVFICDEGDNEVLIVNYTAVNNTDQEESSYSFDLDLSCSLNGTALETCYLGSNNPYAINNDVNVAPGSSATMQESYLLPAGTTSGTIHIQADSYTKNYKKTVTVMSEDRELSTLEKKVTQSAYTLGIQGAVLTDDGEGKNLLIVDFVFTNNSTEAASFGSALETNLFQDGIQLSSGYLPYNHPLNDDSTGSNNYTDIMPGNSLTVREVYELNNATSPVTVTSVDSISYNNAQIMSKTIALDSATAAADAIIATSPDTSSNFSFTVDAAIIGLSEYYNKPAVFMVGSFTNNSDKAMSFSSVVDVVANQGPYSLESSYISGTSTLNYNDIQPGATIPVIIGFELLDLTNGVTITATDSTHYAKQVLYNNTFTIDQLIETTKTYIDRYNILNGEITDGYQF